MLCNNNVLVITSYGPEESPAATRVTPIVALRLTLTGLEESPTFDRWLKFNNNVIGLLMLPKLGMCFG